MVHRQAPGLIRPLKAGYYPPLAPAGDREERLGDVTEQAVAKPTQLGWPYTVLLSVTPADVTENRQEVRLQQGPLIAPRTMCKIGHVPLQFSWPALAG